MYYRSTQPQLMTWHTCYSKSMLQLTSLLKIIMIMFSCPTHSIHNSIFDNFAIQFIKKGNLLFLRWAGLSFNFFSIAHNSIQIQNRFIYKMCMLLAFKVKHTCCSDLFCYLERRKVWEIDALEKLSYKKKYHTNDHNHNEALILYANIFASVCVLYMLYLRKGL